MNFKLALAIPLAIVLAAPLMAQRFGRPARGFCMALPNMTAEEREKFWKENCPNAEELEKFLSENPDAVIPPSGCRNRMLADRQDLAGRQFGPRFAGRSKESLQRQMDFLKERMKRLQEEIDKAK